MECVRDSDIQIANDLLSTLTMDEKNAIVAEKGRLISSKNGHVLSALTKLIKMKPKPRLMINEVSQEYIMRIVKKRISESCSDEQPEKQSPHKNIIEYVKNIAEKNAVSESTVDEVTKKSDAYKDALFYALADIGYEHMDENNKRVADIGKKEGVKAMVSEMFSSSGGDYARMRMMYG
jgi:hypothetical protein